MAPGIIKAFGMDEAGLAALKVPVYITVGARDTQAPPAENAEFAAKYIPGAELAVIPGDVDHEIFVNECDDEGRDEFPEACIDAPRRRSPCDPSERERGRTKVLRQDPREMTV